MFSQTVEYALRAMMFLASRGGVPVTSECIAANTRVPAGYISKVMRDLVIGELVASFRGPHGGFVLTAKPEAITMFDVVDAVDPFRRIHKCPIDNPNHTELCPLHRRLDDAMAEIERSFRAVTLAQMLEGGNIPVQADASQRPAPSPSTRPPPPLAESA